MNLNSAVDQTNTAIANQIALEAEVAQSEAEWEARHAHSVMGPCRGHVFDSLYALPPDLPLDSLKLLIADLKDEIKVAEKDIAIIERRTIKKTAKLPPNPSNTEGTPLAATSQ